MMFDYMTLKVIWFGIMTVILIAFAITGGMDIGVHILLPYVGKDDAGRRSVLNAVGPTWEGNQVWLVTFGAGLFAIWPPVYATAFSSLYIALLLVVLVLVLRPPGFDYRAKINSDAWRQAWDLCLFTSGIVLALVFGVAIGNLFLGMPFYFDENLLPIYMGTFLGLFSPLSLLVGLTSLSMLAMQGGIYLQYKLIGPEAIRAKQAVHFFAWVYAVCFVAAGLYVCLYAPGYIIDSIPDVNTSFAATQKVVITETGAWVNNFTNHPILWLFPIIALVGARIAVRCCNHECIKSALIVFSVTIACTIATAATSLFPFILPSNYRFNDSLTIWDAVSSEKTLGTTLVIVILLLPIVLAYTAWVYRVMRGKVVINKDSY